jgi:predicted permease
MVAVYRLLTLALPGQFRERWLRGAAEEVAEALETARRERGSLAMLGEAWGACSDLVRAMPREWWRAHTDRDVDNARMNGPGGGERMMGWLREVRLAARTLRRRPGYTATAVVTLGLGIGATVAIFTVVNAVLLRPLPYPDADRLVTILHHAPALDLPRLNNSAGMLHFYWEKADFLEELAAYDTQERNLVGGTRPERVVVLAATPQIFSVLGVQPALGRPFNADDAAEGAPPVALLTHGAWTTRFGSDPAALGRVLEIDGVRTEVVGVMPRGFAFPDEDPVALVPFFVDPHGPFGSFGTGSIARLAPGFTVASADRRANDMQALLPEHFPDLEQDFLDQAGWSASVMRFQDFVVGDSVASTLWIVLGTVAFLFLIACANVANLFLVRAESRRKELAVRSAMGAGYRTVVGGFLTEALLLGAAGGALGMSMAWGGTRLLVRFGPQDLPRLAEVSMDGGSLAFAAGLSLAASLLFGALPLFRFAGGALSSLLRDGGRTNMAGRERHRTRNSLVALQLALALVLVVGSGLLFRSFVGLRTVDLGIDPHDVLTVGMSVGESVANREAAAFYQEVADRVEALPGVVSVGLSPFVPIGGGSTNGGSFYIESKPRVEGTLPPVAMYKAIGAHYLEATNQRLLEGRALTRADWEGGEPVLLVNRAFADTYLDGEALGQGIRWDGGEDGTDWARVVGVVENARELNMRDDPGPWAYLPMVVGGWGYPQMDRSFLFIRTAEGVPVPVGAVRDIVSGLNATVPITAVRTLEEVMADELAGLSFTLVLLGIASGTALFLGAIGLFGVISYVVSQRTQEIGVRVALGASGGDIRRMVFRQGVWVAVAGIGLGLAGAAALTRVMGSLLYEVSTTDPISFLVAPAILVAVALTATWLPARRASRVDPIVALRTE